VRQNIPRGYSFDLKTLTKKLRTGSEITIIEEVKPEVEVGLELFSNRTQTELNGVVCENWTETVTAVK